MAKKLTKEEWLKRAIKFHENKYKYNFMEYINGNQYIDIICPIHGLFKQKAKNHLKYGCPLCSKNNKITKSFFIEKSKYIHNNKFNYDNVVDFKNIKEFVVINCPIHGEFKQRVEDHMNGCGCNKCRCTKSLLYEPIKNKSKMREYRIWKSLKTRTTNPNCIDAKRYLYRGIYCCKEWLNSFESFYNDMGRCPEGFSIDRIDNNKGYFMENCRWASNETQSRNRGDFNKIFSYNNETHVLKEWSKIFNINYTTLYNRLYRDKLNFEQAISKDPYHKLIKFENKEMILKDWCRFKNIKYMTVINRMHKYKWTFEKSINTPGNPFEN